MAAEVTSIKDLTKSLKTYMDSDQLEQVKKAFFFAANAHSGQYRISGDPYVTHPVAVAEILAKFKMDGDSLSAAMLHDVIEDSGIPKSFLSKEFNKDVANLVDGVSKLDKIKISGKEDEQAEYFQKMVLAMSQDIRVIVVKLADRLHNMRTLNHLATAKQKRISKETIEIYAPIAHRIGMHQIYRELEDRAFEVLNPHRATILRKAIDTATKGRKKILSKIEKSIKEKLKENDLIGDVVGRQKHLYGIFKKMRKQGKPLSEVLDVYAFKITVESAMDCYKALGVLHNAFSPIEGRFKDYIAIPKSNSYQSLHTGVITFDGLPVEIQIRTNEMDELAEFGIAAHWLYKSGEEKDSPVQARARRWVNNLVEIQKNTENSRDFVEIIKTGLVPNEIYVFTPKGRIIELPKGSTPIDFAFMVHSDIGLHCRGCRINKNLAPLSVPLESGQTVEIITDDIPQAQPSWLEMVITSRARSAIRHQLKNLRSSEARKFGKKLLENSLAQHNLKLRSIPKSRMSKLLDSLKVNSLNDLLQQIGLGIRPSNFVANQIMQAIDFDSPSLIESSNLQISGSEGLLVNYGPCCKPIPGDPVVAHFTAGRGMVIHQERCKNILPIKDDPALCAPVQWEDNIEGNFSTELVVTTQDRPGILAEISSAISEMNKNIEGIRGEAPVGNQVQLFLIIEVSGRDDLANIMKALKKTKNVISVNRVHSSEDRKLRIR